MLNKWLRQGGGDDTSSASSYERRRRLQFELKFLLLKTGKDGQPSCGHLPGFATSSCAFVAYRRTTSFPMCWTS